jgi:DNA-binding protein HU-beta
MNKAELVDYVAEVTGAYKKDVKIAVDAMLEGIERGLIRDGKVTLVNFGNFFTKTRAPRQGRNPQTGTTVHVPAKTVPVFKPSQQLKDAVD